MATDPQFNLPLFGVDAFTSVPFKGNPAAVCLLEKPAVASWMQRVAAEMNLSETAFLVPQAGHAHWSLRWFTPAVEVYLCGHATLASAHVLWESGRVPLTEPAVFRTRVSGDLSCRRDDDWIAMDFPARPAHETSPPPGLIEALGMAPSWVGRTDCDYLVELPSASDVRELDPDHARLAKLPVRGVMVTAAGDGDGYDFISRFFAPGSGVREDPVTGSAHCSLAPFWAARFGRNELLAWQASLRGGEVRVRVANERVELRGQAVTVWEGQMKAPQG
jgi:PhzF family phenazine biosynthesis protein